MEKLKLHTPDLSQQNIHKLAELFPSCVTEARDANGNLTHSIDFDQLRQELSGHIVEGPQERYHLNWPGKREAILTANAPIAKTLRPCREASVNFDSTKNLFIEGDNLDALKLLQETYLGKVKLIYIDPPYNTGNDFIYEDDFAEDTKTYFSRSNQVDESGNRMVANTEANGRFHSDWLSMLYPRLRLSRAVMSDDGAIFISIDDNEAGSLRSICDEIFGHQNFIATFVWQKRYSRENRGAVGDVHEYIVCYAKSLEAFKQQSGKLPLTQDQERIYRNPNNDPKGRWRGIPMTAQGYRPNQMYPVVSPDGTIHKPPAGRCWSVVEEEYLKLKAENRIYFGQDGSSQPQVIRYLTEVDGVVPWTWLPHEEAGHTDEAKKELFELIGKDIDFDTPKPKRLLKQLIKIASSSKNYTVLDFFAGSATTAHAAIELNAEDNGARNFILVQIPSNSKATSDARSDNSLNIAEISRKRLVAAGKAIKDANPLHNATLDTGFRVLKIDTSNMEDVYYTPDQTQQGNLLSQISNIRPDRTPEDLLFQVLVDWGVDLALPIATETIAGKSVYFVDTNALAACFEEDLPQDLFHTLAQRQPLRVVFRDSCFPNDAAKINVEQIFKLRSPSTDIRTL